MTIADMREKCKSLLARVPRDILIMGVLVLASSLSFGLGYLAGLDTGQGSETAILESPTVATSTSGLVVASKSGTKYYAPSCAGANRISEANKVTFASADAAQAAGYSPASNCTGL